MPYNSNLATVVGFSFSKENLNPNQKKGRGPSRARAHGVNVSLKMYTKILHKEGRQNIVLMELPNQMTRAEGFAYFLANYDGEVPEDVRKEMEDRIAADGKYVRYHGFYIREKVRRLHGPYHLRGYIKTAEGWIDPANPDKVVEMEFDSEAA